MVTPGNLLKAAFAVWSRTASFVIPAGLVANLPLFIVTWIATGDPVEWFGTPEAVVRFTGIALILGAIASYFVQGAATASGLRVLSGEAVAPGASLAAVMRSMGTILATALLAGLATGIGFVLLIIPGLIVAMMLSTAIPAVMAEGLGPVAALKRSRQLTEGYRGTIFAALFVLGIVPQIVHRYVLTPETLDQVRVSMMSGVLFDAIWSSLGACLCVAAYHQLRTHKEGVDAGTLARVFD